MSPARSANLLLAALAIALAGTASALPSRIVATDPPSTQPATKREPLPSLDELLGLPNAAPRASDRDAKALDQKLSDSEKEADMEQAVDLMTQSAERLTTQKDPGLPTQRLQEDVLRKLDKLIEQAEQNQQQSKSKKKPSQSKQNQQQQQQQQQQQSQQNPGGKNNNGEVEPPAGQNARPNALAPAAQAAWGNLPDHVRNALVQGVSDKFSSLYQSMTEAYYRRLAEEPREAAPK